jgi:hypothetical protein
MGVSSFVGRLGNMIAPFASSLVSIVCFLFVSGSVLLELFDVPFSNQELNY